jgi:hypothetical protein
MILWIRLICIAVIVTIKPMISFAAVSVPLTVNVSEAVIVNTVGGTPRIAIDVGGVTRYAMYTSGSGTSALTFTYNAVLGDVDLNGITLLSPIDLNGGNIKDTVGNNATLTFTAPNTANVKINYPSLSMDLVADADGRYTLNGTVHDNLSSFLTAIGGTFSRTSIGTYYNSTGTIQTAAANAPRFDYDPVTLQPKGLLIEESRTNFIINSSDILNWTSSFRNGTAGGLVNSPDGGVNGRLVTLLPSQFYYGRTTTFMPLGNYTASAWLKGTPGYTVGFRIDSTSNGSNQANISVPLTGSWRRVSVSFNLTTTSSFIDIGVDDRPAQGGSGTGGVVQIWGGQIEAGSFSTSYIPTTTAVVTRAADVFSIPTGGWFNATDGTAISSLSTSTPYGLVYRIGGGSGSIGPVAAGSNFYVDKNSTGPIITHAGFAGTATHGLKYSSSGIKGSLNGGVTASSPQTGQVAPAAIYIGSEATPANMLNGNLSKFKYYPLSVSDTQLQLMSQ